jgi:hypothetical protein
MKVVYAEYDTISLFERNSCFRVTYRFAIYFVLIWSIQIFIGFNGFVSVENSLHERDLVLYHQSTSGQLPKSSCYDFDLLDKGWRVEMEIWTTICENDSNSIKRQKEKGQYRTFLQLDTPISRYTGCRWNARF